MVHYNRNVGEGMWVAKDGTFHHTRTDAEMASKNYTNFQFEALGAIWKLFCLIPYLLGVAIGAVCGLVLKLGVVGRVILSALVAFAVLIALVIPFNEFGLMDYAVWKVVGGIVVWVGALAAGAWFWIWHYDVVRQVPYRNFVSLTTLCMVICFWGMIVLLLIDAIWKIGYGFSGSMLIPLAAAIALWLFKVDEYKSPYSDTEAAPSPTPAPAANERYAPADLIWARWSGDGNLYLAKILANSATGVKVVFYDGVTEEVAPGDVFYLTEATNAGMTPHGNWEDKGDFYPCEILETGPTSVLVRYTEDQVQEELPYHRLVFMK